MIFFQLVRFALLLSTIAEFVNMQKKTMYGKKDSHVNRQRH